MWYFFASQHSIDEILPDSDYRKYIRLAGGMVLILIVFSPVLKLFNMTDSMDYYYQWESLKTAVAGNSLISGGDFDGEAADSRKNDWILSQYEDNLKEQITVLVKNEGYGLDLVSVSVDEDESSEAFGQILAMTLEIYRLSDYSDAGGAAGTSDASGAAGTADAAGAADTTDAAGATDTADAAGAADSSGAGGKEVKPVETVAPVNIGESPDVSSGPVVSAVSSDEILSLKKLLSGNYGVHMNQITIHVRGR